MNDTQNHLSTLVTAAVSYGENNMFSIRAGIPAEEALLYACHLLKMASAVISDGADNLEPHKRSSVLGGNQHVDSARAFIDAVMEGAGVQKLFTY